MGGTRMRGRGWQRAEKLEIGASVMYIRQGYTDRFVMSRTKLFQSNRSQAVRLPKDVAFPAGVAEVTIRREGNQRIILPADAAWDDFFASDGTDLGEREQPPIQERERF